MPAVSDQGLSEVRIGELLAPYLRLDGEGAKTPPALFGQLATYLDLLLRWNARTNLTSVRDPETMVRRHFGESLFAGLCLRRAIGARSEVLDLGSGAGFPGLPIQLLYPELRMTLAESQGKKVAFLREVVRSLGLDTQVWSGRVEDLPAEKLFDAVTLRAVDRMAAMVELGRSRLRSGGALLEMIGEASGEGQVFSVPEREGSFVKISLQG